MTKHILAVDDSLAIRQVVGHTLRSAGYVVSEAGDGEEALALARSTRFDMVLTDLHMPRLDGIGLIEGLRALAHCREVPVIVLTTESSEQMRARGRAAGATGWMVKPFEPRRLLEVAARVLG
ncbi:response regulator [Pseudothauera lacus]|uniref:Response regulator n=1 Tax=Pseudothauera lacus TaxID=2136175 RepID=A0A2T4IBY7_9RHOO|nr:response regulator [Pseudothauera lacus]PTD95294.1 response regulator [Pseudothauera lacus]